MAEIGEAAGRGLLRNRAFLAIWSAQILSQVAANAITSALIVLVAEQTKSNTSSSFLILLAILPATVFGIMAGVFVDRTDRKILLVATNAARAVVVVVFLLLGQTIAAAYVVNFLIAAVTTFFVPAESAMLPAIVRKRDLLVANSLFTFTFNGAFLVGFIILAPVLIALAGFDALFIACAAMFAAASILCAMLPAAPPVARPLGIDVAGAAVRQTRRGMSEAFAFLRAAPTVTWAIIYVALTYTLVAMAGALAPGFVREVLGVGERNVVILVAPAGVGVIGGLGLLNWIGERLSRSSTIGVGLVSTGTALVVLAGARPVAEIFREATSNRLGEAFPFFVATVAATMLVFGVAYAFTTVPAITLIQEELHDDLRGRVFGLTNVLVSVFSLLPLLIVGPIADVWGVAPVFLGAAVIVFIVWYGGRATRKAKLASA